MKTVPLGDTPSAEYPLAFVVESEDELRLLYLALNRGYSDLKSTDMVRKPSSDPNGRQTYHDMWEHMKMALVLRGLRMK